MMRNLKCISLGIFLNLGFLYAYLPGYAQQVNFEDFNTNAIRISASNAIRDVLRNTGKANFQLEFFLLPSSSSDFDHTIHIKNEELGQCKPNKEIKEKEATEKSKNDNCEIPDSQWIWLDKLNEAQIQALEEALCGQTIANSEQCSIKNKDDIDQSTKKFRQEWSLGGSLTNTYVTQSQDSAKVKPSQYFGLNRDHAVLQAFLLSKGINYSIQVNNIDIKTKLPKNESKNISWEIRLKKIDIKDRSDEALSNFYYRISIRAVTPEFKLVFPTDGSEEKINLTSTINFSESSGFAGQTKLTFLPEELEIDIEDTLSGPFEELVSATDQPSVLDSVFNFATSGSSFGEVASAGLFGSNANVSVVGGALISSESVEPFAGANLGLLKFGDDASAGVLFGVGTEETLFVGPSIQWSAVTLSGGLRVFDENDSTDVDFGGLVSVDLSRIIQGRNDIKRLRLDSDNTGGYWDKTNEEIVSNLVLAKWETTQNSSNEPITFTRICDQNNRFIDDKSKRDQFKLIGIQSKTRFIPRGTYVVSWPSGWDLGSQAEDLGPNPPPLQEDGRLPIVEDNSSFQYRADRYYSHKFELLPNGNPDSPRPDIEYKRVNITAASDKFILFNRDTEDKLNDDLELIVYKDDPVNSLQSIPIGRVKVDTQASEHTMWVADIVKEPNLPEKINTSHFIRIKKNVCVQRN